MVEDYSWGAEARRLAMQDPDRSHLRGGAFGVGVAERRQVPIGGAPFGAGASLLAIRVVGNGYILDDGRGATLVATCPEEVCSILLEALARDPGSLGGGNVGG